MESITKDLLSILSVVLSSLISIFALYTTWREKQHMFLHTERYSEWRETRDIIAQYAEAMTLNKLRNYLLRAGATYAKETPEEFFSVTEAFVERINKATFQVLSIAEIQSDNDFCNDIRSLNKKIYSTIGMIHTLKLLNSTGPLCDGYKKTASYQIQDIESAIKEIETSYLDVEVRLQKILADLAKAIKP